MKVALLQLNCTDDVYRNLDNFILLSQTAAERNAKLIVSPEVTNIITIDHEKRLKAGAPEMVAMFLDAASNICLKYNLQIVIGSMAVADVDKKCFNRQFLIASDGSVMMTYDKIHMFDIQLSSTEQYKESQFFKPGSEAKIVDLGFAKLGMTICYDLRFSEIYRNLAIKGAELLTVPSAFTKSTGALHWEVLLRARAIETGCFVLAAAQCGQHDLSGMRESFGNSMIVNPWGKIIAKLNDKVGICYAQIDVSETQTYRSRIPNLKNIRDFQILQAGS